MEAAFTLEANIAKQCLPFEGKDWQIEPLLVHLSVTRGGAWSFSKCFDKVWLYQAKSPCKLPDDLISSSRNRLAYKGVIRQFTNGSIVREQNRGLTKD